MNGCCNTQIPLHLVADFLHACRGVGILGMEGRRLNILGILSHREENAQIEYHHVGDYAKIICNSRVQYEQKLSTLFPALGSKLDTMILGFTSCGDYLVSLDELSVRFHQLSLSREEIQIRAVHFRLFQGLNFRSGGEMPWWTSPMEILISNLTINRVATLYFAQYYDRYYYHKNMDDIAASCDLRFYSSGNLVLSTSISAVLSESCLFDLPTINDAQKTVLYINNGNYVSFYLFGGKSLEAEYNDITEENESGELPSELSNSKTFFHRYSAENDWFSCNMAGNVGQSLESMNSLPLIPQSKLKIEKFLKSTLLPFYYPELDVLKSLKAFEIRCLGPGERGSYILMVISCIISPYSVNRGCPSVGKEIAYLITFHPFLGDITVLKIKDLSDFYKYQKGCLTSQKEKTIEDNRLSKKKRITSLYAPAANQKISFRRNVDFYCTQIIQSDPFLRKVNESFTTLSSVEIVSGSLMAIPHPFLPLIICNDEG